MAYRQFGVAVANVVFADFCLDFGGEFRFFGDISPDYYFDMTDFYSALAVPRAGFLDGINGDTEVDDFADARNTLTVEHFKFGLFERRRHFVFHHFDPCLVAQYWR